MEDVQHVNLLCKYHNGYSDMSCFPRLFPLLIVFDVENTSVRNYVLLV